MVIAIVKTMGLITLTAVKLQWKLGVLKKSAKKYLISIPNQIAPVLWGKREDE